MHYLTLASMIRNEEHNVAEWLTFHHLVGFEQFVLVLHRCEDKTEERIRSLPFADKIRIHRVLGEAQHVQLSAFVWMAETYGTSTEWMLFCDSDEFSFGTEADDFRTVLEHYDSFGGLFLNWMEYGHNRHFQRPQGLCIESYTKRAPAESWWHKSGKTVVKPRELLRPYAPTHPDSPLNYSFLSPHTFRTAKPTVHTDFTPVSYRHWWCTEHISHDIARCNHYRYRSREDWLSKCNRGNVNDAEKDNVTILGYATEEWEKGGDWQIVDESAMRFAERVRQYLAELL